MHEGSNHERLRDVARNVRKSHNGLGYAVPIAIFSAAIVIAIAGWRLAVALDNLARMMGQS